MPLGTPQSKASGKLGRIMTPMNIGMGVALAALGWLGFKYARNRDFDDLFEEEQMED